MADPYAAQLKGFTSSIPNARRGLIDLYKLRRQGIDRNAADVRRTYGAAGSKTREQYGASQAALAGFGRQGLADVQASGYGMGDADTRAVVQGMLAEGTSPFAGYLKSEGAAQGKLFKGLAAGEQAENATLKTGLARERPAALSELEQGIVDTQTSLAGQSSAYQAQNQFQAQQQNYMSQMLSYQGQAAGGAQGMAAGGGGGLSAAEQFIVNRESEGNVHADNPTSTAFGLGQLLQGNRNSYGARLGINPNTTDYGEQLQMMRAYIADRYGSAQAAMQFWQGHGWY